VRPAIEQCITCPVLVAHRPVFSISLYVCRCTRSPAQGFVEVTIKRLEDMLLNTVIELMSKDLLDYYQDSRINGTL